MPASPDKRYVLVFDGGSLGNPGAAYGSFSIQHAGEAPGRPERVTFGQGTNNEAEYKTLIAGLKALHRRIQETHSRAEDIDLVIRGDSLLVIEQLKGRWKVRDARMRRLHDEAERWMNPFGRVRLLHQPRRATVRLLGH